MSVLACPDCHGALAREAGAYRCGRCQTHWPDQGGFPKLYREKAVRGSDRFMRLFYNGLPALHDPLTRHLLPRLQRGGSEAEMRRAYMDRVEIDALETGPARVLEVGVGAGGSARLVRSDLPTGVVLEYWGLDLSEGMLGQARRKLGDSMRLVLGDAHHLPFASDSFDRVFHVGAIGSYGDPARALAEMARVARPGTPIVVVDEELDPTRQHRLHHRLAFRLLTFYDRDPHAPMEHLPPGVTEARVEPISRFYYCLRFRAPSSPSRSTKAP